jgi:hypothetical protein
MNRKLHFLAHVLGGLAVIASFGGLAVIAGFGLAVMLLWNALVPSIFGITAIDFWQALGLLALCRILFGSFGVGHRIGAHFHRNPVREKWQKMTPEEREEFIRRHRYFGHGSGNFNHDLFNKEEEPEKND